MAKRRIDVILEAKKYQRVTSFTNYHVFVEAHTPSIAGIYFSSGEGYFAINEDSSMETGFYSTPQEARDALTLLATDQLWQKA